MFNIRNLAKSVETAYVSTADTQWTTWTLDKAVTDGYVSCGWVHKAVSLIARNASTVPFVVKNSDNEIEYGHPLTKLLLNPHPFLNRLQFYELLHQWLQLSGNAYLYKITDSRQLAELYPISPDRIKPKESTDNLTFTEGYVLKKNGIYSKSSDFENDEIIHFNLTNPANPIMGISPLEAASKSVDLDNAQQNWNTGTMQNRGVVDSVFTFDRDLDKQQSESIMARIMSKFSSTFSRRQPLVLGSGAKYTRLSLTPAEVDFIESRKFNMSEIFIIFGIPPQLGGSEAASTYNNFSWALRVFWETTLIPLINGMATQFNNSFKDVLENGYYIAADYTNVEALKDNEQSKADTAKSYYDMGVPVSQLNTKFEMGLEEYDGWDKPFNGLKQSGMSEPQTTEERKQWKLIPNERRSAKSEAKRRDKIAEGPVKNAFSDLLKKQQKEVLKNIDLDEHISITQERVNTSILKYDTELQDLIQNTALSVAADFSKTVIVDQRGNSPDFEIRGEEEDLLLDEFINDSSYILAEKSLIQEATVKVVLEQVREAYENNWTVEELRQALEDTGVFSPERALRIARTEVGSAASIGQMVSGKVAGAQKKEWNTGGFEIREIHSARDGEVVGIDDRFSIQSGSIGPRFPSDPHVSAEDRINCKCFLSFL